MGVSSGLFCLAGGAELSWIATWSWRTNLFVALTLRRLKKVKPMGPGTDEFGLKRIVSDYLQ